MSAERALAQQIRLPARLLVAELRRVEGPIVARSAGSRSALAGPSPARIFLLLIS